MAINGFRLLGFPFCVRWLLESYYGFGGVR